MYVSVQISARALKKGFGCNLIFQFSVGTAENEPSKNSAPCLPRTLPLGRINRYVHGTSIGSGYGLKTGREKSCPKATSTYDVQRVPCAVIARHRKY